MCYCDIRTCASQLEDQVERDHGIYGANAGGGGNGLVEEKNFLHSPRN